MERIPEPELMEDDAQARAYAEADFDDAHSTFIDVFRRAFEGRRVGGCVLDLGCGPADITLRFARAFPKCRVHGVDGSEPMLRYGRRRLAQAPDAADRIELIHGRLPGAKLPRSTYDVVISNSLLHHLPDPRVIWDAVRRHAGPGAPVFVMDLKRPQSRERAAELIETYAAGEPEVLRRDFYNSLLAAFEIDEIRDQLRASELDGLAVEEASDRHVVVSGFAP